MSREPMRAVALMGATASGKSQLAEAVAGESGLPLLACDSMQVYPGLDIGTAKPDATSLAQFNYELIDFCPLPGVCSAAQWAEKARASIAWWNQRGVVPLIVGGTGMYLRALLDPFAEIPPEKPEVRQQLAADLASSSIQVMHARLAQVDGATAARLSPNDTQRILRALAVYQSSGRSLTEWFAHRPQHEPIDCPIFVLDLPRPQIYERIGQRFEAMVQAGWLDEVRWLASLKLPDDHPAQRAVGYRQFLDCLAGEFSFEQALGNGVIATRHYAKRQLTWFRHQQPEAVWAGPLVLADKLKEALR